MKLYTVSYQGEELVCVAGQSAPEMLYRLPYGSMNELICAGQAGLDAARRASAGEGEGIALADVRVLAPIPAPRQDVICLGMNYMKHKAEAEKFDADAFTRERGSAVYFSKRATHCPGHKDQVCGHFDLVDSLDYETELAVIIGKDAKNVAEEDVFSYVFGYTIVDDFSARNLQTGHKQWYFGKGLDDYTPMGPCIVTADEFVQPPSLPIRTRINGELRQDALTSELIFGIPYIIHELTQGMTLQAGTVIATGTPAGVGMGFNPPKFLKPGDVVTCEIEGIGVLENTLY